MTRLTKNQRAYLLQMYEDDTGLILSVEDEDGLGLIKKKLVVREPTEYQFTMAIELTEKGREVAAALGETEDPDEM